MTPNRERMRAGLRNASLLAGASLLTAWLTRCGPPAPLEPDAGTEESTEVRLLDRLAHGVIVPALRDLAIATRALEEATRAYAGSGASVDREAARAAWRAAMSRAEEAELMQLGPAGPEDRPGGRGLRDEIYSFPVLSRCRVDQVTASAEHADVDALARALVNVRGLDAIEYLLFTDDPGNACAPVSPINAEGTWARLGPDEIGRRRAAYAAALAVLVRRASEQLADAWDPSADDFAGALARPGAGGVYPTPRAALDAVYAAMFYLDLTTKDRKLAAPLGLLDCASEVCPELVESPLAGTSNAHVASNLRAFEVMFLGAEPGVDEPGFDDLLAARGHAELASSLARDIAAARASIGALAVPLAVAVVSDRDAALAVHAAIKRVTDAWKGPVATALSLTIPLEGAGDND